MTARQRGGEVWRAEPGKLRIVDYIPSMTPAKPANLPQALSKCIRAGMITTPPQASKAPRGWRAQRLLLPWLPLSWFVGACGLPPRAEAGGSHVHCPDGSARVSVSCSLVSRLKTRVLEANVGLGKSKLGLSVAYED